MIIRKSDADVDFRTRHTLSGEIIADLTIRNDADQALRRMCNRRNISVFTV